MNVRGPEISRDVTIRSRLPTTAKDQQAKLHICFQRALCEFRFFLRAEALASFLFLLTTGAAAETRLTLDCLTSRPVSTMVAAAVASAWPACTMLPAMPPTLRAILFNKGVFLGAGVFGFILFSSVIRSYSHTIGSWPTKRSSHRGGAYLTRFGLGFLSCLAGLCAVGF